MSAALDAAAAPLLIVLLGGLFLADYQFGWTVARTWPALLIAAGLLRLAGWGRA